MAGLAPPPAAWERRHRAAPTAGIRSVGGSGGLRAASALHPGIGNGAGRKNQENAMTRDESSATSHGAIVSLEELDHLQMEDVSGGCANCGCQNSQQNQSQLAMLLPMLLQNGGLSGRRR
jgi:hypothetical protein